MPATPAAFTVVPPVIFGSTVVPVAVTVTNGAGANVVVYTTLDGSVVRPAGSTISAPTTFFIENTAGSGPFVVSCVTSQGQQVAGPGGTVAAVFSSPSTSPAGTTVQCVVPVDGAGVGGYQRRPGAWQLTTTTSGTLFAQLLNAVYYQPRVVGGGPIDRIAVGVTTGVASSAQRFGIYLPDAAGMPGTLVTDLGTVATTATGTATLTVAADLPPGLIYFATVSQGGASGTTVNAADNLQLAMVAPDFYNTSPTNLFSAQLAGYVQTGISGALPSTATVIDHGAQVPKIGWRWA